MLKYLSALLVFAQIGTTKTWGHVLTVHMQTYVLVLYLQSISKSSSLNDSGSRHTENVKVQTAVQTTTLEP